MTITTVPATPFVNLYNSKNNSTTYSLAFTSAGSSGFVTNGKANGGLLTSFASQFGSNSEFAIATATEDYIYTTANSNGPVITFSGLNSAKRYKFKIFGSRNSSSDRTSQYTFQGAGSAVSGSLNTSSTVGLGGLVWTRGTYDPSINAQNQDYSLTNVGVYTTQNTYYGNNSSIYTSGLIQPDGSGNITLTTIATGTTVYAYINSMKIEEYQPTSTWTGTGNWSNNSNWTNTLQTSSAVTIASGELTIDQNATVDKITVNPGAKLTLSSGKTITSGTLNLNSDASGTATFVDNGGTTSVTVANIQQYLTTGRNWYISSPVSGANSSVFNAAAASNINKLYSYDETNGSSATLNWPQIINNSTSLAVTRGYVANVDASLLAATNGVTFSGGSINTGTITTGSNGVPALTRTVGQTKEGFNLVGNPYPSYLDWTGVSKTNLESNTMWYRTKVSGTYYFYTYNSVAAGIGIAVPADVTNLIPPMQAFWVRAAGSGSSLTFHNTDRAHKDVTNNILRSKAQNSSTMQLARLQVSNGVNSDETVLYTYPSASNQYDSYDSPKMSNGNAGIPEIYTLASGENLVINGLNSIPFDTEIPLGFTTGQAGTNFSIKASQLSNFDVGTQIILKDYQDSNNPVISDLSDGSSYVFSSDITNSNTTRFALIFKTPSISTGINSGSNDNVWISTNANNQIMINSNNGTSSVAVYNGVGQKLYEKQVHTSSMQIENHFVPGIYMVSLTNTGKTIIKKVIID